MELVVAKAFAGSRQQVVREFLLTLSLVGNTLVVIKEGEDKNWGGIKTKGGSLGFSQEPKQRFYCV